MMRKILLVIVIMTLCTYLGFASGYTVKTKVKDSLAGFSSSLFNNPATKKYLYKESYWEINSSYNYNKKHALVQDGDRASVFLFNTHSCLKKSDKLFYGDLQFSRGKKENVRWCESSDYELIFPYVLANSDGGDMNFEEYFFLGGFSKQKGMVNYGIEASYRAKYEYRLVDPRPRNIVSDYSLKMGLSVDVFNNDVIGFDITYGNYTQANEVRLFKNNAKQKFFIMEGFGYYDHMFSKVYGALKVYYDIESCAASIQYFSKKRDALFVNISFKKSMLEQDLNAFNDINTLQLEIYDVGVDVGYSLSSNFLTKLYGKLDCRNGYENIYENLSFNKYRLTTVYNNYKSKHFELNNSYLFLFNKKEQNIQFEVSYNKIKQEYRSTHMFQKISSLDATISYRIKKNNFSTNIYMGYSKNLESDIRLADDVLAPKVKEEALLPNYLYLSSDKIHAGLNASYQYRISSDKSLFFRGDCKLEHIKNRELSKNLVFTTGLTF